MKAENRISLVKDLRFVIYLIGICSLIGLFEKIIPILDLFNHFRVQAIVGAILVGISAFFLKDRKGCSVALIIFLLNSSIVGYRIYKTGGIDRLQNINQAQISVVAANVLTSNTEYQSLINLIAAQNPDVIVLTEVDNKWLDSLKALEETYKYSIKYPRADNFGIAAFSKIPMEGEVKSLGMLNLPVLIATVKGITIFGAHPIPPASIKKMNDNRKYIEEIAFMVENKEGPFILAGDLNTTLWSSAIDPLIDTGFKRINPSGISYTWPKGNALLALQIDHFFGKDIEAADFRVLPSIGSDHYPIRADILVKDAATN